MAERFEATDRIVCPVCRYQDMIVKEAGEHVARNRGRPERARYSRRQTDRLERTVNLERQPRCLELDGPPVSVGGVEGADHGGSFGLGQHRVDPVSEWRSFFGATDRYHRVSIGAP